MRFWCFLIKADKKQTPDAMESLVLNSTHVDDDYWIFEGLLEVLEYDGVKYSLIAEGAVPSLGGLSTIELVAICGEVFGVDIYQKERY